MHVRVRVGEEWVHFSVNDSVLERCGYFEALWGVFQPTAVRMGLDPAHANRMERLNGDWEQIRVRVPSSYNSTFPGRVRQVPDDTDAQHMWP